MQTQDEQKLTTTEARQGRSTGVLWVLVAGTIVTIVGLGSVMVAQAL